MDVGSGIAVDAHAHYLPRRYLTQVEPLTHAGGDVAQAARQLLAYGANPAFSGPLDERIARMDAAGIQTQILSFSSPNVWHPAAPVRAAVVRAWNDATADLVATRPDRFRLFANVPLPFVEESIAETDRARRDLGAVGVSTCTHVDGAPFVDERYAPLLAHWNERAMCVFLHPDGFCVRGALADYGMDWILGAPFDDTLVTARLIYARWAERYPRITWIVPHLGGALPILIARMDDFWARSGGTTLPHTPSAYLGRFLFDSVTTSPKALRLAADALGAGRLVLGSDYPYAFRSDLRPLRQVIADAGLSEGEIAGLLSQNLARALARVS